MMGRKDTGSGNTPEDIKALGYRAMQHRLLPIVRTRSHWHDFRAWRHLFVQA